MKKLLFFAAVAAIALTSCQQEKDIHGSSAAGENEITFSLQSAATRASEAASPVSESQSISIAKFDGFELFLEETVTDLNYAAETRGTPVYTENAGYLYKDKLGIYVESVEKDATYSLLEETLNSQGWWVYQHRYSENIWPDESTRVQFYHRMPTDMTAHGVTSLANASGATTVSYTSPATATQQQDIIFGGTKLNHKQYIDYYSTLGGAPVTLYHALTGVKFAIKNTETELAKIKINKISFIGLKNTGTFTFNTVDHTFDWGETRSADPTTNVISQTFDGDLVTYDANTHASNNFADSFFAAGTSQNLNDAQATKTFWLVPQDFPNSSTAQLRIDFTQDGEADYILIDIKDLKNPNWQAGQLRTYTFKVDEVNLKIRDAVSIQGNADNGYMGSQKTGVTITNTGNTRAFIRAAIVGQWVDYQNDPVFGFTDKVNNLYKVASWYEDQFVTLEGAEKPARKQGLFLNLAGYDKATLYNNWQLCKDGYYYYTKAVEPGAAITDPLFTSYTIGIIPNSEIAGAELDNASMHFELEIATQAIKANSLDGTVPQVGSGEAKTDDWEGAWAKALGSAPVKKQ